MGAHGVTGDLLDRCVVFFSLLLYLINILLYSFRNYFSSYITNIKTNHTKLKSQLFDNKNDALYKTTDFSSCTNALSSRRVETWRRCVREIK